jgi:NAD(P)-dependent dehydrogenase (short-subunit alcohol dehydrogenase family)
VISKTPLEGKVAIVTGGGRGIGKAIAKIFAERGAKVVVTSRTKQQLDSTVKCIHDKGGTAFAIAADVIKEQDVTNLINRVVSEFGTLDILVNNAGSFHWIGPLWEADASTWWDDVTINLKGIFLCCRYAIPIMIKQHSGVIINLSGGGARNYLLYGSSYASSKAAVLRITEQIARELKDQQHEDIVAYAVNPGLVITEMTKYQAETPRGKKYIPGTKECFEKGTVRQPEECGYLCAWLTENRPKAFSGRLFTVQDDLNDLLSRKQEMIEQDFRFLRVKMTQ